MKAYIYSQQGRLEPKELSAPDLAAIPGGERGVLLRPVYVSPCTSDVHTVYQGNGPRRENLVLGHEGLAVVLAAGSQVRDFCVGETAAVCAVMPEPETGHPFDSALTGHENMPFSGCKLGRNIEGMWQEVFYVPDADHNLAKLPPDTDPLDALMAVDVMATGFSAVEDAGVRKGETVLVFGSGAIGLMAAAAAHERGAHVIVLGSGNREYNTGLAMSFGADAFVSYQDGALLSGSFADCGGERKVPERSPKANHTGSPAVDFILDATGGKGVDVCIIAGGMPASLLQACDLVKYGGGRVVNVSYIAGDGAVELPVFSLGRGMAGKSFLFSLSRGGRNWTEAMLQKSLSIHPGRLVTHRMQGFESIPEALELMHRHEAGTIKIAVKI